MRAAGAVDVAGFAAYIALLAWASRRRASGSGEFLVAGRALGLFPLVATLVMTEFNTSTLLSFSAMGYQAGPMAVALPLVFLVGLAFYTLAVARKWKRFDRLSVAELFADRYSPALGRFASVMLLAAMTGFSATYVKSMTLLFVPVVPGVTPLLLGAVLTVVALALVMPGGLMSVVRVDVVSFSATAVMLPVLLAVGYVAASGAGGLQAAFPSDQRTIAPAAQWTHDALPFWFVSTLIVLTCATYIAAPWYGQKMFAAKDERTAFAAAGWSAVIVFALYSAAVLAAAYYRVTGAPLADPQLVLPRLVHDWLPPGARGAGLAVLFSAALTTLAGLWTAMGAMLAADFVPGRAMSISAQRLALVVLALASWLGGSFLVDDILNRLILANVPVAALAFALLAGFYWPRATTAGAWASVLVGVLWGAGTFVLFGEAGGYTWYWSMYGVPLIFGTGIAVSLVTRRGTA